MSHASGSVPRRSPSRQSSFSMRSKADSAVEEEIVVAPDDGWHSDSSGSVYNASPRSPKAGGDASPAQYDSSKYAEQDEIGPVKVYTHTSAPRAIFPVRMISSRDGEEEVLVGRGGGYKPIDITNVSGRDSFKAPSDYDPLSPSHSPPLKDLGSTGGGGGHFDNEDDGESDLERRCGILARAAIFMFLYLSVFVCLCVCVCVRARACVCVGGWVNRSSTMHRWISTR